MKWEIMVVYEGVTDDDVSSTNTTNGSRDVS